MCKFNFDKALRAGAKEGSTLRASLNNDSASLIPPEASFDSPWLNNCSGSCEKINEVIKIIENLKGRRNYEEKRASKLGFASLYDYFEDKISKKQKAIEEEEQKK